MKLARKKNFRGGFLFFPKIKNTLVTLALVLSLILFAASFFVAFFATGAADEFFAKITGNRKVVYLSFSNIRDSFATDKWVVARIDGDLSDSVVLEREFLPDLKFKFERLPAFYNYFVPLNDQRWAISCFSEGEGKSEHRVVKIDLPEIEFDATATLIDISKLKIKSENMPISRLESTAQELREGLIKNIVNRYNWQGFSPENFAVAKNRAILTIKQYAKNRLLEQGIKLDDTTEFRFNWIEENSANSDTPLNNK